MSPRWSIAAILASGWLTVLPSQAQILGGDLSIDVSYLVVNGPYELGGGDFQLQPSAGTVNLGELMLGGEFSLTPAPVFTPAPAPLALLDLSRAHAFPVPFRPFLGHTKITFTGLSQSAAVAVYTINGESVKNLSKDDPTPALDWNPVSNEKGERVASGLYLFIIKNRLTGERKLGKLIIIR